MTVPRTIAVALDGSEPSNRAVDEALDLARLSGAKLVLIGVVPMPVVYGPDVGFVGQVLESSTAYFERILAETKLRAEGAGIRSVRVEMPTGSPVEQILETLRRDPPDLLVMGARGLSAPGRLFLGSVSDAVVHHSPCSVLVVRPPPGTKPPAPHGDPP